MTILRTLLLWLVPTAWAASEVTSGKASASWIGASASIPSSGTLQTSIRIRMEPGWHVYWTQPGEGGMKTDITLRLPPGWTHESPGFPPPQRFLTGELASFGYEGSVLIPVVIRAAPDFTAPVELKAGVSWLACNQDACVPGDAELSLHVRPGPASPTAEASTIEAALRSLPRPLGNEVKLHLTDQGTTLGLRLTGLGHPLDFSSYEAFPATPDLIQPSAVIRFVKVGNSWSATAPKSPYAPTNIRELKLVLASKQTPDSWEISWKAE